MSDEVSKAQAADANAADTIFGKILRKEIPCEFIHEDDQVFKHISISRLTATVINRNFILFSFICMVFGAHSAPPSTISHHKHPRTS